MYGKRFVTGDRQKACLFEQKGSYMASIKDSNGQFKTLQLGTNRPVAFKQFFAAASAAGFASVLPAAPAALRWETRAKHACGNVTLFTYVFSADPREESA